MKLIRLIQIRKLLNEYKPMLFSKYPIKEIGIFGSYVRNEQTTKSDLDILVDFERPIGWDVVILKEELENILKADIDLVIKGGLLKRPKLWNYIKKEIVYI